MDKPTSIREMRKKAMLDGGWRIPDGGCLMMVADGDYDFMARPPSDIGHR
jgi:hypothetical protein